MRLQPIFDIAEVCSRKGIRNAVVCPGSRCAPLTLAFAKHSEITTKTFSDERSAGFIANGISLETHAPTVLVSTSGSAALNFAPAISEAYYQQIPLLIFTADRPKEWIDQYDGQTIKQQELYGKHVKKYFELPQEYDYDDLIWQINRVINEAINLSNCSPKGPVHINVPLKEPLYLQSGEKLTYSTDVRTINSSSTDILLKEKDIESLKKRLLSFTKVLLVVGQHEYDKNLSKAIDIFSKQHHIPAVAELISNQHLLSLPITHADVFLDQCEPDMRKALQPELLITCGKSIISKNVKQFLRTNKPMEHWNVSHHNYLVDTYQSATEIIVCSPISFFNAITSTTPKSGFEAQKRENYYRTWKAKEHQTKRTISTFFKEGDLDEFSIVNQIMTSLPKACNFHLANSMPVRYANTIGLKDTNSQVKVYANRGTSGIDGCTSTTVGQALESGLPTILITGDMAFFYDRNAFWHNYKLPNLRIVVLNNHGGSIFSIIDGPSALEEIDEYFVTDQKLTAKSICYEFDFDYIKLDDSGKIKNLIKDFFEMDGRTKIIEIEVEKSIPKKMIDQFKQHIRKSYES